MVVTEDDLLARLRDLRTGRRPGGGRAPHKPLLILVALARRSRGLSRLAPLGAYEAELAPLLARAGVRGRRPARLPIWHLQSDDIWEVVDARGYRLWQAGAPIGGPRDEDLGRPGVRAGLTDAAWRALDRPGAIGRAFDVVLAEYFPDVAADLRPLLGVPRRRRAAGRRRYWWANQGRRYAGERKAGYLWAPLVERTEPGVWHQADVGALRRGDVVFHHVGGAVRAISRVAGPPSPSEGAAAGNGFRVPLDYHDLSPPVPLAGVRLRADLGPDGPFDRDGRARRGHFFPIPSMAFVRAFRRDFAAALPAGSPLDAPPPARARTPDEQAAEGLVVPAPVDRRRSDRSFARIAEQVREIEWREHRLVDAYVRYLVDQRRVNADGRHLPAEGGATLRVDIFDYDRHQLVEAKPGTSREEIRMAIGQLADYARYIDPRPACAVLLPHRPPPEMERLLSDLGVAVVWKTGASFEDNAGGRFT